jgi:hypothetical protein
LLCWTISTHHAEKQNAAAMMLSKRKHDIFPNTNVFQMLRIRRHGRFLQLGSAGGLQPATFSYYRCLELLQISAT